VGEVEGETKSKTTPDAGGNQDLPKIGRPKSFQEDGSRRRGVRLWSLLTTGSFRQVPVKMEF
jgi:hypothetical protein